MGGVPPAKQCTMCEREAANPERTGALCPEHHPDAEDDGADPDDDRAAQDDDVNQQNTAEDRAVLVNGEAYSAADFTIPEREPFPEALGERERWMVRGEELPPPNREKAPYAPWADADGAKWGEESNRADLDTAREWVNRDPRVDGLAFIQTEPDPLAFVDGDDVRCPDTGEVHPAFVAILEHLGATYSDVSTSGSGAHAHYLAPDGLPIDGKGQADFAIDTEPWGANTDLPTVEIYANKHNCVTTGKHVPGTPLEVREWDADALQAILEANGYGDEEPVDHDTDRDRPDLEAHEPDATGADETAGDVRDVLAAVDRLRPRDLPLQTRQVGTDATGWEQWDPGTYRQSSGNDSLHTPDSETFHDHKKGETFGVLKLFALEQGIISRPGERLAGQDWWDAVDAAREAGAPIPEFDPAPRGESEPVAVLSPAVRDLSHATTGWDWQHVGRRDDRDADPMRAAQDRTTEEIADALESFDHALVEALPTLGKSYGAVKAVAETGEPATVLTNRGNVEQYDQYKEWAAEFDLDVYTLPSFTRDCPTANGDHGEDWAETVDDWYRRGATPQEIHAHAEYHLGEPLPCQAHEGQECPYTSAWRFDPDEFDLLLGHYTHAYNQSEKVTVDRAVLIDEFPGDAYERALGGGILKSAVTHYLRGRDAVPFDDYTDLLEHRDDDARRADALAALADGDLDPDTDAVFQDSSAHADAPLAVFTILAAGDDLGNGLERASFPDDDRVGVFDRAGVFALDDDGGGVRVLDPPPLEYARSVVALDGTPTPEMWELSLGAGTDGPLGDRMTHRRVLTDDERREYVRDHLNLNVVRTTEYVKPYNSADHVDGDGDLALLKKIVKKHGQAPGLITPQTALEKYDAAGVLDLDRDDVGDFTGEVLAGPADRVTWRGNVLGSNEFSDTRLGAVIGSTHYGDHFIKKWGAYAGEAVKREAVDDDKPAKGENLTYGPFGDKVHHHMTEHDTLQTVMRFGRDGNGAVVYCHTNTLPEWLPLAGEGRVVDTWSDGERQVLAAAEEMTEWRTAEIAAHPVVEIGQRQVFNILDELADRGALGREWDGRGWRWTDEGLEELPEYGEVDLPTTDEGMVDLNDLDDETVQEIARNTHYTWDFPNTPPGDRRDDHADGSNGGEATVASADGADRPPDPGD